MKTMRVLAGIFLILLLLTILSLLFYWNRKGEVTAIVFSVWLGILIVPIAEWYKKIKP